MSRPRLDFVLADEVGGEAGGYLCHDSFRRAKKMRADAPGERPLVFRNAALVDPAAPSQPPRAVDVHVFRGLVQAIVDHRGDGDAAGSAASPDPSRSGDGPCPVAIDCAGFFLFPGLSDAHVHCTAVLADLTALRALPASLTSARAAAVLGEMLRRGFTAVRDCGGADHGLARAVDEGTVLGPRVLFSGRALSQTGGHGDMRAKEEGGGGGCACACAAAAGIGRVCDGADAVRLACREELRLGSHFVKVMASGGVSSPTDALEHAQFSEEELRAASDEAGRRGSYVGAHAYTPHAIRRAVACGARSIEHGNYLDADAAREMAAAGAFLVPTLVTYWAICRHGAASGFPRALRDKARGVAEAGAASLRVAKEAGVRTCFGSDLLGDMHAHQSREFALRAGAGATAAELLASATVECAALFALAGPGAAAGAGAGAGGGGGGGGAPLPSGRVRAGGPADFCLSGGNPLSDWGVLARGREAIACVVKDGLVAKAPSAALGDGANGAACGAAGVGSLEEGGG